MKNLTNEITKIGNQLVTCKLNCEGICNDPKSGAIPRCLYLETENRKGKNGCVVVGLNPGKSDEYERKSILKNKISYETIVNYWQSPGIKNKGTNHPYYRNLRKLIDLAGFTGPIVWTELVKCETHKDFNLPTLQTFRTCTHHFLTKELDQVPADWPIIAVGREAHKALSYLYPQRSVLGVPHPTASQGNFANLFSGAGQSKFKAAIQTLINKFKTSKGIEVWLKE